MKTLETGASCGWSEQWPRYCGQKENDLGRWMQVLGQRRPCEASLWVRIEVSEDLGTRRHFSEGRRHK